MKTKMNTLISSKHKLMDLMRFLYHLLTDRRVQQDLKRYWLAKNKKDKAIINDELKELKEYWGFLPLQYFTHDFYSINCELTLNEMKSYIPGYYFYKIIFPRYDDVKIIIPIIENKISMNKLFKKSGIERSTVLFIKESGVFKSFDGDVLLEKALIDLIKNQKCKKLFIKPVSGRGGAGILIAHRNNDGQFSLDDLIVDANFLKDLSGDYIIETAIEQLEYISNIYPHSVNTLRAITKRDSTGNVGLVAVTLRMGVHGSQIDNSHAGGILIGVNLETGSAFRDYATYEYGSEKFYNHPDTGFKFSDLNIPNWSEVRQHVINSAEKLKDINLVGWDVALVDGGVVMIEVNTLFGLNHTQAGIGGLEQFFITGSPMEYFARASHD